MESRANPLKVLHGLIEPAFGVESLDVAVVGISNWSLDAAKMNRAIHLSRPDPGIPSHPFSSRYLYIVDEKDLLATGKAIRDAFIDEDRGDVKEENLERIASAYFKYYGYQKQNKHKNFHGIWSIIFNVSYQRN